MRRRNLRSASVRESSDDIGDLQSLLDESHAGAGRHLRSIFDDEHRLGAERLVAALDGIFEMHLAIVAENGAPLVAPVDGIFYKGQVWFGLVAGSVRERRLHREPRVSASYTRDSFALIVHGMAQPADESSTAYAEYDTLMRELYVGVYGPGWVDWYEQMRRDRKPGSGFIGWIAARAMFAKA